MVSPRAIATDLLSPVGRRVGNVVARTTAQAGLALVVGDACPDAPVAVASGLGLAAGPGVADPSGDRDDEGVAGPHAVINVAPTATRVASNRGRRARG